MENELELIGLVVVAWALLATAGWCVMRLHDAMN